MSWGQERLACGGLTVSAALTRSGLHSSMSHNSFGHLFRITTWGESHGPAIGCVVDGCPPGIPLTEADIQVYLDKRKPGQSRYTTQGQEPDKVAIIAGVFNDEEPATQVATRRPSALELANDAPRP